MSALGPAIFELVVEDLPADLSRLWRHARIAFGWCVSNWGISANVLILMLLAALIWSAVSAEKELMTWRYWTNETERLRNLSLMMTGLFAIPISVFGLFLVSRRTAANELQAQAQLAQAENLSNQIQNLSDQLRLGEQAQITDRFTKAIEQLGSKETSIRLGAIYALERIGFDSVRDVQAIIEILAAFVRNNCARPSGNLQSEASIDTSLASDVLAAIKVLIRVKNIDGVETRKVDLRNCHLPNLELDNITVRGFELNGSDLSGQSFRDVRFVNCEFDDANFSKSHFHRCEFRECGSWFTNFESAFLNDSSIYNDNYIFANFRYAHLEESIWKGVALLDVDFDGAILSTISTSADFSQLTQLDPTDFERSEWDERNPPRLPRGLTMPQQDKESEP